MQTRLILASAGLCVLAGCASAPQPDSAYTSAQSSVQSASSDPDVLRYAEPQFRSAQNELSAAGAALQHDNQTEEDHHAFMAMREAETAQQIAAAKRDQQRVANAPLARDQALLQRQRSELAAARRQPGLVETPRDILFAPGSAELNPTAQSSLQQVAAYLRANPGRKVRIRGFTDSTGSAALNEQLSQQRADAVRLALANDGVDPSRIEIEGMGPAAPIAANDTTAGRLLNRRVQIMVSNADGTFPQPTMSGTSTPPPLTPSR